MKVGYATVYDATNIGYWSGLGYYISKSLQNQGFTVAHIGPLEDRFSLIATIKQRLYRRLLNKTYLRDRSPFLLKEYSRQTANKLAHLGADVVFSPGVIPVAQLQCEQPIVIWTDAVFAGMIDFYPDYRDICNESIADAISAEKAALTRCKLAIYSSQWAADIAVNHYGVEPSKVKVVPFGANIDCHRDFQSVRKIVGSRPKNQCNLLFLAVEWHRKGGDEALSITNRLNRMGLRTKLAVAGCEPPVGTKLPDYVTVYGYVDKRKDDHRSLLDTLFANAHFLVLPTIADCTPVVFSEANSFAVPCLSTIRGGISSVIYDGINGKLFPLNEVSVHASRYILDKFKDYDSYTQLALSSFREYETRLNWDASGRKVKELLMDLKLAGS